MSVSYLHRRGFSINEGGRYANIHCSWLRPGWWILVYLCIGNWRRCWRLKRAVRIDNPPTEGQQEYLRACAEVEQLRREGKV